MQSVLINLLFFSIINQYKNIYLLQYLKKTDALQTTIINRQSFLKIALIAIKLAIWTLNTLQKYRSFYV